MVEIRIEVKLEKGVGKSSDLRGMIHIDNTSVDTHVKNFQDEH